MANRTENVNLTVQELAAVAERELKAARQGDMDALFSIGRRYHAGLGLPQDYAKAAQCYTRAAEHGHRVARYNMGLLYFRGTGFSQDYTKAMEWLLLAAHQEGGEGLSEGDTVVLEGRQAKACIVAAPSWAPFREGEGVAEDLEEAFEWVFKAAKNGYAEAQYQLGFMYEKGLGIPAADRTKAMQWYSVAAGKEHSSAKYRLGRFFFDRGGCIEDYVRAMKWFLEAANQGHVGAQYRIGVQYQYGLGVERNEGSAKNWYRIAAERGHIMARTSLNKLENKSLNTQTRA